MELGRYIRKAIKAIIKWSVNDNDENRKYRGDEPVAMGMNSTKSVNGNGVGDRETAMNFTVYGATGGKVVQFSSYDPRTDRHHNHLYIVTDKEDLGEEIGQIITKESLSR